MWRRDFVKEDVKRHQKLNSICVYTSACEYGLHSHAQVKNSFNLLFIHFKGKCL